MGKEKIEIGDRVWVGYRAGKLIGTDPETHCVEFDNGDRDWFREDQLQRIPARKQERSIEEEVEELRALLAAFIQAWETGALSFWREEDVLAFRAALALRKGARS